MILKKSLLLLFLLITHFVFASESGISKYDFKHLGLEQGLSHSSVISILQDKTGFIWIGTKDGLNRFDGISFRTYQRELKSLDNLGNNSIRCLFEDKNGNIWIGTNAGMFIYDPQQEKFTSFNAKSNLGKAITEPIIQISADSTGIMWFSVEKKGLFRYDVHSEKLIYIPFKGKKTVTIISFYIDKTNHFWMGIKDMGLYYSDNRFKDPKLFLDNTGKNCFPDGDVYKIIPENFNHLIFATPKDGIKKLNIIHRTVTDFVSRAQTSKDLFVRNLLKISNSEWWVGTESGIYIYNSQTRKIDHLEHYGYDPYSLSDNAIYILFKDRVGGIWVGSYFGGIDYYAPRYEKFEKFYPILGHKSISGKAVREFCEDKNGNLWIGTEDAGLNLFNPTTGQCTRYQNANLYHNIHALCLDNDKLWIGTFSKGLHSLDLKTKVFKSYLEGTSANTLNENSIYSMCKTSMGDLYVGTPSGLNKYNRNTDDFTRIKELNGIFVFDILEDRSGCIWFATLHNGIYQFNPLTSKWTVYRANPGKPGSLPSNMIISVFEDSKNQLWFTTEGNGFCRLNRENGTFITYETSDGLPNDVVYKMLEDSNGLLWLTTNKGLSRFNPYTKKFKTYTTANGLLTNQFNYSSSIRARNGKLYFGGINGFIGFDPVTFQENRTFPPVVVTDFFLFNKRATVGNKKGTLQKSITFSDRIDLRYNQNSFTLKFSALSFIAPQMNVLSYKLEGFDKEWYTASGSPSATYTNIKPGIYMFCIKSSNSLGEWNKAIKKIEIHIHPPFWQSGMAYVLYLVLLTGITWFLIRNFRIRMLQNQQRQLEKLEAEKEKEIHEAKVDFFTNVAHEIRTPLTLIKGPLENVLKKNDLSAEVKEDLSVMEKNTQRLLDLTNQLLDFRKTEVKGFSLNFIDCNISELLREIYCRFHPTARNYNLNFKLTLPENEFFAPVDKEAMIKIISNLFNNAIKFATSRIEVTLLPESPSNKKNFSIMVINDGAPIPTDMKEIIFKPFTQLWNTSNGQRAAGTGIGLPLARSLAELHKGSITLNETPDICFSLELPVKQENVPQTTKSILEKEEFQAENDENAVSNITLLLVDDDLDILRFIGKQLKGLYTILTATNGLKALEILENQAIDLIVSDVMMPEMDGFELCRKLKSDINFSHIPIILLTAKANLQSKIEGIELGADSYIEKPFSSDYLLARIANLLSNQEKRRKAFESSPLVESRTMAISQADELFLDKLSGIIHKNLSETTFNVDLLASEMNMSRSSLHRKIKSLSQLTPNDFIQIERLKKAAQLIQSGTYRINEICYLVGFNSSSYFAKCFQKQFGILPKDFGKQE